MRRAVNAALVLLLLGLSGCSHTTTPARWVFQWMGGTLPEGERAYSERCFRPAGEPRWKLITTNREYSQSDYALLGTGEGTLDLAPRGKNLDAEPPPKFTGGPRRLDPISSPLASQLEPAATTRPYLYIFLKGGGVMEARWLERGRPEARGEDVLGEPFGIPDDTIVLPQGRVVVAGKGIGRVAMKVRGADGNIRLDYGMNAGVPREMEAYRALDHGVIRIPIEELREVEIHSRGATALPSVLYAFVWRYPKRVVTFTPAAMIVSLGSILASPFHRPVGGADVTVVPAGTAVRIGKTGVKDGRLWIAFLPPEGSDRVWALRPEEVRMKPLDGDDEEKDAPPLNEKGYRLARPVLLDPAEGTKFYFFGEGGVPGEFELQLDAVHATDGAKVERTVYRFERDGHVRWNPVAVWHDWACDEPEKFQ